MAALKCHVHISFKCVRSSLKGRRMVFLNVCIRIALPDNFPAAGYHQTENITRICLSNVWIADLLDLKLNFKAPLT